MFKRCIFLRCWGNGDRRAGRKSHPHPRNTGQCSASSNMGWGSSGAISHLLSPTYESVSPGTVWDVWAAQQEGSCQRLCSWWGTWDISAGWEKCGVTGLAKLQGGLEAFNYWLIIIRINLSSAFDWKFCGTWVVP